MNTTEEVGEDPNGEDICKICFEAAGEEEGLELVKPCSCRGSAANIHVCCLKKWHLSMNNLTLLHCPTCRQAYVGQVALTIAEMNLDSINARLDGTSSSAKAQRSKLLLVKAKALTQLAQVLSDQGRYSEALPYFKRSLDARTRLLGPDRLEVAETLDSLAEMYRTLGQYAEALEEKRRALAIREKVLGFQHPKTATSYNNLGLVLQSMHRPEEAQKYFERALDIYSCITSDSGERSSGGSESTDSGSPSPARQQQQVQQQQQQQRHQQSHHPNLACVFSNLGSLFRTQGKLEESKEMYQRCLTIREQILGSGHILVAESLNNLALVSLDLGDPDTAHNLHSRCLAIATQVHPSDHPELVNYLGNYGMVLLGLGREQEAKQHFEKAIADLKRKNFKDEHVWLVKFSKKLKEMGHVE